MGNVFNTKLAIYEIPEKIFPDEEFRMLVDISVETDNLKPYYLISTYGRLYNICTKHFLCPALGTDNHYYYHLVTTTGCRNFRVARLVMLAFAWFPGCEKFIVNHLDGKPYLPYGDRLSNLEWTDYSGNILHAIRMGLRTYKTGEESHCAHITEAQAIEICERIQSGEKYKSISESMGVTIDTINHIANHRSWAHISCNYTFPVRKKTNKST